MPRKRAAGGWVAGLSPADVRFHIDPRTRELHIYEHDVDEEEVLDVLLNRAEFPSEDRGSSDGSRTALGQTQDGRYLKIIYVPDADKRGLFVVTAYELEGKPLKAFKKLRRKKP